MLYDLIRTVISIILIITGFLIFKIVRKKKALNQITNEKHKSVKKFIAAKIIFAVLAYSLIAFILSLIPFENLFIDFSSPQDVFKYTKQGEIDKIIYGDKSCMIYYNNYEGRGITFVRKEGENYKIVPFNQYSDETIGFEKNRIDDVYTENRSGDTYYSLTFYNRGNDDFTKIKDNIKISDDLGTEFYLIKADNYTCEFCGYVKDYSKDYSVHIQYK